MRGWRSFVDKDEYWNLIPWERKQELQTADRHFNFSVYDARYHEARHRAEPVEISDCDIPF